MGVWDRSESRAWVLGVCLWSGALCPALALAACGGRTTLLDGDPNDVSTGSAVPGGGSGVGTSSSGGTSGSSTPSTGVPGGAAAPSTGVAGGSSAGGSSAGGSVGVSFAGSSIAGAPSTTAGGPGVVSPACLGFCESATSPPCQLDAEPFGQCLARCEAQTPLCQELGNTLLDCILATAGGGANCFAQLPQAELQCAPLIQAFQQCSSAGEPVPAPPPIPVPPPEPIPPPPPTPVPLPPNCTGSGAGSPTQCTLNVQCQNGAGYGVLCLVKTPTLSVCWCANDVMGSGFDLNESVSSSCFDALTNCAPNSTPPM